ncbi:MAG: zf-HC2 domain-containing protein, partial [Chloroflexia bacterium]
MDCKAIRPLISYYYDGEATPEERVQVEQHLATCADCRQVLAQYRAMSSDIHELPMPTPPSGLHRDVWRAIEAHQASTPRWKQSAAQPQPKVVDISTARKQKRVTPATVLANNAGGWARAVPAALVVAALGIMIAVLLLIQGRTPNDLARLVDAGPFSDPSTAVQILFSKEVNPDDAKLYTTVSKLDGTDVSVKKAAAAKTLTITPEGSWEAGTTYQVHVETSKIKITGLGTPLGSAPIVLEFSIAANNTPTPTNTAMPTATVVPTNTVEPTQEPTLQPTAVAQNTLEPQPTTVVVEPSATAEPPTAVAVATDTPRPQPTNTPKPAPTNTAVPPKPSATPTVEPTAIATATLPAPTSTATPTKTEGPPTSTSTSHPPTATPTPSQPCSLMPVNGFGLLWNTNPAIRSKIGCPNAEEFAILDAVDERFEGGYMFWRGDTKKIYVFFGNPNQDTLGTWAEYDDTWAEGDPLPTPVLGTKAAGTPPEGKHVPVRGFG